MFVNLVNTDIPFNEYNLTQDQIDALKFRLLQMEGYLDVSDFDEQEYAGERYRVFLLNVDSNLAFLIISLGEDTDFGYPVLRMVDMSGEEAEGLSDEEVIDFILRSYEKYPDRVFIPETYIGEANLREIVRSLWDWLGAYVYSHHKKHTEEIKEDPARHHYEAICGSDPKSDGYYIPYDFTPEGKSEIEHLMTIVLKKIYNIDFTENIAKYIES